MNKYEFFTPLMHKYEYDFVARHLNENDTLLEWGSGNSTIYWAGLVNKVITIEHDKRWIDKIKDAIDVFDVNNIEQIYIAAHSPEPIPCRYAQFTDYVEYPKKNKLKFTKVLIDGRARKYCAKSIWEYIDENVIVMIHDFNRPDYQKVLKYFDIIDRITDGQGIVSLKKKASFVDDKEYY